MPNSPHSSASPFVAEAPVQRDVLQKSRGLRVTLCVIGVLLGLVVPALTLYYDSAGYDVTCRREEQTCTITDHRIQQRIEKTVRFDEIRLVQIVLGSVNTEEGDVERTGRVSAFFILNSGEKIRASSQVDPEDLPIEALRAYLKAPSTPSFSYSTSRGVGGLIGVIGFFLIGLFLFSWALWFTEVTFHRGTRQLEVRRRRWPLLRRTMLSVDIDDLDKVVLMEGELNPVIALLRNGERMCISTTLSSISANELISIIDGHRFGPKSPKVQGTMASANGSP